MPLKSHNLCSSQCEHALCRPKRGAEGGDNHQGAETALLLHATIFVFIVLTIIHAPPWMGKKFCVGKYGNGNETAVVAYVVCMYRVRARLFATGRPHHATAPCDGMTDRQHDSERDGIHTRHGDTAGSLTLFRILTLTLDDLYLRYSRSLFSRVGIS